MQHCMTGDDGLVHEVSDKLVYESIWDGITRCQVKFLWLHDGWSGRAQHHKKGDATFAVKVFGRDTNCLGCMGAAAWQ